MAALSNSERTIFELIEKLDDAYDRESVLMNRIDADIKEVTEANAKLLAENKELEKVNDALVEGNDTLRDVSDSWRRAAATRSEELDEAINKNYELHEEISRLTVAVDKAEQFAKEQLAKTPIKVKPQPELISPRRPPSDRSWMKHEDVSTKHVGSVVVRANDIVEAIRHIEPYEVSPGWMQRLLNALRG